MYQSSKYFVCDDNTISSKFVSGNINIYHQFFTMHGLKQPIKSPTRVTFSTSTLINHILAGFPSRVSQTGVIDERISHHQLIFCTQKISRPKTGAIHKYFSLRSYKNYTVDSYRLLNNWTSQITKIAPYRNK